MIGKQDILERARQWQLRAEVVEKDYVLGWLLAAIAQHEETSVNWVLKGGTCVKKCFFETYRFSEDLDFSLLPEAVYGEEELLEILRDLAALTQELSGIEFSPEQISIRPRQDRLGRTTFEGKLGYRGPLAMPGWPKVLFDITQHEPIVDEPILRPVFHPYPDALPEGTAVQTYSIEELVAEKTRALVERSRPRDLYDVVLISSNVSMAIQFDHAREVFRDKCSAKQLPVPSGADIMNIIRAAGELASEWDNMLAHQLPQLPPLATMLERASEAVAWVDVVAAEPAPIRLAASGSGELVAPAGVRYWPGAASIEPIRFAGANRLRVRFAYHGSVRTLEPYSLRRSSKGKTLLYAFEMESGQIKAFDVNEIGSVTVTSQSFVPQYLVEFTTSGSLSVPLLARRATFPNRTSHRSRRSYKYAGPTYVFTCPVCNKEFRHRRNDSTLRRHKFPGGFGYCSGRRGLLLRVS